MTYIVSGIWLFAIIGALIGLLSGGLSYEDNGAIIFIKNIIGGIFIGGLLGGIGGFIIFGISQIIFFYA